MLHHLSDVENQLDLVRVLIELFEEIDINDDQFLEWEEFSNYIIELGILNHSKQDANKKYLLEELYDDVKHENDIE